MYALASAVAPGAGVPLPLVFLFGLAVVLLVASTPLLRAADAPPTAASNRVRSLDGLRGFLALAVVFSHLSVYRNQVSADSWTLPQDTFSAQLGPCGVSLFFMITAYLFWGRLLRNSGRLDWVSLYIGRVFRIGPVYFFAFLFIVVGTLMKSGLHLEVSLFKLAKQLVRWLSMGIFIGIDLNDWYWAFILLAGVLWSLQWEWCFYFSLPVLALLARRRGLHLLAPLLLLAAALVLLGQPGWPALNGYNTLVCMFLSGMLCASLGANPRLSQLPQRVPDWLRSVVLLGCLALALEGHPANAVCRVLELLVVFYLVTSGCTVFGLLLTRPARRLGDLSYGIYLLQGVPMFVVYHTPRLRALARGSAWAHWALGLVAVLLLLGLALVAHRWVELPGMALGRRTVRRLEAWRAA